VTVVSTIRTQPPMIADELRRQADTFLELHELSPYIAREHRAAVAVDDDEDDDEDADTPQRPAPRSGRFYQPA
jgi:hypothetical protein